MAFSMPMRVYIEDTDAGGIVYYVNYLKFMERARTECIRELGFDKPAIVEEDKLFVVHSASINYLRPALLDDQLTITAAITRVARSYMLFAQSIFRGTEPICTAEIKVACVNRATMKPIAMPPAIHTALQSCQLQCDAVHGNA